MGSKPKPDPEAQQLEADQDKMLKQQEQEKSAQKKQLFQRQISMIRRMQGGQGGALPSLLKGLTPTSQNGNDTTLG